MATLERAFPDRIYVPGGNDGDVLARTWGIFGGRLDYHFAIMYDGNKNNSQFHQPKQTWII